MYMYIYPYAYTYTATYTPHTHIHIHVHIYTCVYIYSCIYTHTRKHCAPHARAAACARLRGGCGAWQQESVKRFARPGARRLDALDRIMLMSMHTHTHTHTHTGGGAQQQQGQRHPQAQQRPMAQPPQRGAPGYDDGQRNAYRVPAPGQPGTLVGCLLRV